MQSVSCAICGEDNYDRVFSKWGMTIVRCRGCSLVYVNPRNILPETDEYFRGPYLETIETNGALKPGVQHIYGEILDRLEAVLNPGRLLDVGCAMGHFMAEAEKRGWKAHGVEPCSYAADYGRTRWGLRSQAVTKLEEAHLPEEHFDACVMVEVAEHLSDPLGTFQEVFRLLKPGGMLYVTTPNFASTLSLLLREEWDPIIPTGHLYYFTADTLAKLLDSIGFATPLDLTQEADFASVAASLKSSGRLRLDATELARLRERTAAEDADKLGNGRSEGLVMSASKPCSDRDPLRASLRYAKPLPPLENRLIATANDGRVYLVRQHRKHWVTSVDWLTRNGMRLQDTLQVEPEVLSRLPSGSPLGVA